MSNATIKTYQSTGHDGYSPGTWGAGVEYEDTLGRECSSWTGGHPDESEAKREAKRLARSLGEVAE